MKLQEGMDWKMIFSELIAAPSVLEVDELAAALFARGRHALEGGVALAEDETLRKMDARQLLDASLHPGTARLRKRFEEALTSLDKGGFFSETAERALVAVLNTRDHWLVRSRALIAIGILGVAQEVEASLAEFDAIVRASSGELGSVSEFKAELLAENQLENSIWKHVPDAEEIEPAVDEAVPARRLSQEELLLVALGRADELLERRVALAIAADPKLREQYDEVLEDIEEFEAPVVIPLSAIRLLRGGIQEARPLPQRKAAADRPLPRYAEPTSEDELFSFEDGSQLFAQRKGSLWVLFLYRLFPSEEDSITGSSVEQIWREGRLLGAEVRPGEVEVRCNAQIQRFRFDALPS